MLLAPPDPLVHGSHARGFLLVGWLGYFHPISLRVFFFQGTWILIGPNPRDLKRKLKFRPVFAFQLSRTDKMIR